MENKGEESKDSIKPEEFLEYATNLAGNYKKKNKLKKVDLINIYGHITKGFCSQLEEFYEHLKPILPPKKNKRCRTCFQKHSIGFEGKFKYAREALIVPEEYGTLYQIRDELEHDYTVPSADAVHLSIATLKDFITKAKEYMKIPTREIKMARNEILKRIETSDKYKNYDWLARNFLQNFPKNPKELTQDDAYQFLAKLNLEGANPTYLKNIDNVLKHIYEIGLKRTYVSYSKIPEGERKKYRRIDSKAFLKILNKTQKLRTRVCMQLAWHKGLKPGRLRSLKKTDLAKMKLPLGVKEELDEYLESIKDKKNLEGWLLPGSKGSKLGRRAMEKIFKGIPIKPTLTAGELKYNSPSIKFTIPLDEVLTRGEFKKILSSAKSEKIRDLLYFIYYFGTGKKQLLNIRYWDINFKKMKIKVKPASADNDTPIEISEKVTEKLREYCDRNGIEQGKLFPYCKKTITNKINDVSKLAGIGKKVNYKLLSKSFEVISY